MSSSARLNPASECTADTSRESRRSRSGRRPGTLGEHGLADTRRAVEKHVMPTGSSYLTSPLGLHLTGHVCQVKPTLCMLACRVAHDLNRIDQRHRLGS